MAVLGADVDQLDALVGRLRSAATKLTTTDTSTSVMVRSAEWHGPDAIAFRSKWNGTLSANLRTIADAVGQQADTLAAQARQQRAASEGGPSLGPPGGCFPVPPQGPEFPPPHLPIPPRGPDWPVPSDPVPPRWPERPTPPRVIRTETVTANGSVGVGPFSGKVEGTYRIEYLDNGRVRITEVISRQGGVGADAGVRVEVDAGKHEFRSGAMAGAGVSAGLQYGRTWEVPAEQADEVIVAVGLEKADPTGLLRQGASAGSRWIPGRADDNVRHYLDYDLPPPSRTGVDVIGSGNAYAMLGANGGAASANARVDAGITVGGFTESDGDFGVRFGSTVSGSARVDTPALTMSGLIGDPPSVGGGISTNTEIVFGANGEPKQLSLEVIAGTSDNPTMTTASVEIVTPQQRADVAAIRDMFANPTPQNIQRVQDINWSSDWKPYTNVSQADLTVGGEDYGAGVGAGAIPGLVEGSVDLGLSTETVNYDYHNPAS